MGRRISHSGAVWVTDFDSLHDTTAKGGVMKCDYAPRKMAGFPVGMFHCPECGEMVIAGMAHPDYDLPYIEEPTEGGGA